MSTENLANLNKSDLLAMIEELKAQLEKIAKPRVTTFAPEELAEPGTALRTVQDNYMVRGVKVLATVFKQLSPLEKAKVLTTAFEIAGQEVFDEAAATELEKARAVIAKRKAAEAAEDDDVVDAE